MATRQHLPRTTRPRPRHRARPVVRIAEGRSPEPLRPRREAGLDDGGQILSGQIELAIAFVLRFQNRGQQCAPSRLGAPQQADARL